MSRRRLLLALALLVPAGLLTKASDVELVRGYLGGVVYVVFWTWAVLLARPAWRPARVAVGVFLATCALELLQLWHPRWLEAVRATFLGAALLGSDFAVLDFPCYALGAALAVAGARMLRSRAMASRKRINPGMLAVLVGFGCALVASLFARDAFGHWLPRFGVPVAAAVPGMVVTLKLAGTRRS